MRRTATIPQVLLYPLRHPERRPPGRSRRISPSRTDSNLGVLEPRPLSLAPLRRGESWVAGWTIAILLLILGLAPTTASAQTRDFTWTGNAGDNDWHTSDNWSCTPRIDPCEPDDLPGPTDDADLSGASVVVIGGTAHARDVDVGAATLDVSGFLGIEYLTVTNTGAALILTGGGTLEFAGGNLTASVVVDGVDVTSSLTTSASGGVTVENGGSWINYGTVTHLGLTLAGPSFFRNMVGSTVWVNSIARGDVTGGEPYFENQSGGTVINRGGTFDVELRGGGTFDVRDALTLTRFGDLSGATFDVDCTSCGYNEYADLIFESGGWTLDGVSFQIADDARLWLQDLIESAHGASFTGAGRVYFQYLTQALALTDVTFDMDVASGVTSIQSSDVTFPPAMTLVSLGRVFTMAGSNVVIHPDLTVPTFYSDDGRTIDVRGALTVTTELRTSTARIAGGIVTVDPGATARFNGAFTLGQNSTLNLNGTTWVVHSSVTNDVVMESGSTINNAGTLTYYFGNGNTGIGSAAAASTPPQFHNTGTFDARGGDSVVDVPFANSGTVTVTSGIVAFTDLTNTSTGLLKGSGGVSVPNGLVNAGVLEPGSSPGLLTLDGSLTQTADAGLTIELEGTAAGSEYDQLGVTGSAILDGTLEVALTNGYEPASGDRFTLVTCGGGCSGTFDAVTLPPPASAWQLHYNASDVELELAQPLPVELAAFEARADGGAVLLHWTTTTETNNAGFDVQRSLGEAGTWETTGHVEGAGTTTEARRYTFHDEALPFEAAAVRYRLRQVDFDGTAAYSPEVEVALARPAELALHGNYPNPFSRITTIHYELPEAAPVRLAVYDVLGREVTVLVDDRQPAGRHAVRFVARGLASGLYVYRLDAGGRHRTRTMMIRSAVRD